MVELEGNIKKIKVLFSPRNEKNNKKKLLYVYTLLIFQHLIFSLSIFFHHTPKYHIGLLLFN